MTCSFCKREFPDDSVFCPFCGKINIASTETIDCVSSDIGRRADKNQENEERRKHKRFTVILLASLILMTSINVVQCIYNRNMTSRYNKMTSDIDSFQYTIESLRRENEQLIQDDSKADAYDAIVRAVRRLSFSSSSSHFFVDKYIICLKKGSDTTISLTANWDDGGTVSANSSNTSVADILFTEDSWYTSTPVEICSRYQSGVATITFSNDVDDVVFSVLVIVTD